MKKEKCMHLIGYFTKFPDFGKVANYYDLFDSVLDINFILKNDFVFFNKCPYCGKDIDKISIISHLYIDLNKDNSRRLFK